LPVHDELHHGCRLHQNGPRSPLLRPEPVERHWHLPRRLVHLLLGLQIALLGGQVSARPRGCSRLERQDRYWGSLQCLSSLPRPSAGSRCGAIVMVKPAEHRYADNARRISAPFEYALYRNSLPNSLVRPCDVEIPKAILLEHLTEVPFADSNNVVETVAPDAAEKSLANRIHERSLDCRPKNAHAGALCGTVEVGAELAVVVADDELGRGAEGCGFPELLRRPLSGWVSRYPDMHDVLGVDVDDEECKDRPEPDVIGLQEIAGPDGVVVSSPSWLQR